MIGGSKKYKINFQDQKYTITVKRPLRHLAFRISGDPWAKRLPFGKERHEYLFSFSFLEKKDLNIEDSVIELLLFLNPDFISHYRIVFLSDNYFHIIDINPEFEGKFKLFTEELDKIIASHSKMEDEYITGLKGLLTRLRIEKAEIYAHRNKEIARREASRRWNARGGRVVAKGPQKSRNRKSAGRHRWRSIRQLR
jgi:hypothetical protein